MGWFLCWRAFILLFVFFYRSEDVPLIKTLFPNSEITYVKDAGHWVHSEKSTEFSKLVLNFLNE